ncbi:MAG: class I SAM-dependent methyltransferase [Vicinamibacterales bacterium]
MDSAEEQRQRWNGAAGHAWVESQAVLDQLFEPLADRLADLAAARRPDRLLDVGCGTGSTTVAIARRLGTAAACVGVDISEPMLAAARARAAAAGVAATFICADAQTYPFEPGRVDLIVSRFGVMFFQDSVAAFGNLRRAARDGGELRMIVWRGPADNPFMTVAQRAAAPVVPLPERPPDAPGPFAFANDQRVRGILRDSGWSGVECRPVEIACTMPERELVGYFTRFGPVGIWLQNAGERTRAQVIEAVRPAFDRYVDGDQVRFTAACWMVSARAEANAR